MGIYYDLSGQRFGMITVVRRSGARATNSGTMPTWIVRCDCGTEKVVLGISLRRGRTKSCGCQLVKHGMHHTPEYRIWSGIIDRCTNQKSKQFRDYGGRGIQICQRWRESFEAFYQDMGTRPSAKHSIDRMNNNGNYDPRNCRWATPIEQARNKRTSHVLCVGGVSATLAEWAERTGIGKSTIRERLRRGWTAEKAIAKR